MNLKWMIREKKRNCWQKFLKEHGTKDPWEVVRLAKHPWELKSRTKTLKGLDGKVIEEEDRAGLLKKRTFCGKIEKQKRRRKMVERMYPG